MVLQHNKVQSLRLSKLLSKAELAKKDGISVLTLTRIENGDPCRLETMRKIILALGYSVEDQHKVFPYKG